MAGSVKLNKQFYCLQAIRQAIEAYKHLAKFSIHQTPRYYSIKLSSVADDFRYILKDEFSNYALVLSKNARG